ncbi:phosphatidylinositol transfer protein [Anaeramoeba flamelloides]|uniref:Phosphatidylinositol transfer protein n=1 Tax=Anaeramoeba flamelloides TaxID=1746091 RepID=A0AAV7YA13_9EUKA|nr:phosphatidylinositol transfer protein [Anaeramoeba flamelloides]
MLIKEYRIILPIKLEQYQLAQLYMVAKETQKVTKESSIGEGIEIVKNEPYEKEKEKGQFTHKVYHIASKLPVWLSTILPESSMLFVEKAWNAFPVCMTKYNCPFFTKFGFSVQSIHQQNAGTSENVFNLNKDELKKREVVMIDLANDPYPKNYEYDVRTKESKCGVTPLKGKNWIEKAQVVMCCYKLVRVEFSYWGFSGKVESFVHKKAVHETFIDTHRKCLCWADQWWGLKMKDIRKIEKTTQKIYQKKLRDEKRKKGEKIESPESSSSSSDSEQEKENEKENEKEKEIEKKNEEKSEELSEKK